MRLERFESLSSLFFVSFQKNQILDGSSDVFAFVVLKRDRADVSVTSCVAFFDPCQRPQVSFDVFFLEKDDRSRSEVFGSLMPLWPWLKRREIFFDPTICPRFVEALKVLLPC